MKIDCALMRHHELLPGILKLVDGVLGTGRCVGTTWRFLLYSSIFVAAGLLFASPLPKISTRHVFNGCVLWMVVIDENRMAGAGHFYSSE